MPLYSVTYPEHFLSFLQVSSIWSVRHPPCLPHFFRLLHRPIFPHTKEQKNPSPPLFFPRRIKRSLYLHMYIYYHPPPPTCSNVGGEGEGGGPQKNLPVLPPFSLQEAFKNTQPRTVACKNGSSVVSASELSRKFDVSALFGWVFFTICATH